MSRPDTAMTAHRRNITLGTLWLPVLVLAAAQPGLAQSTNWDRIKQLAPGAEIRVQLKDRGAVFGQFESATAESLVIRSNKGQETLAQPAVARVWSKGTSHRLRNALIGFGIGAGAGLGVGVGIDSSSCKTCFVHLPNVGKELFTPLGAIVGGLVGFLLPSGGWLEIYHTP
jgi:hypothetical protein